jgi:outer membrane autotransporter protein
MGEHAYGGIALDGGMLALGRGTSVDTLGNAAHGLVALGAGSLVEATGVAVMTQGAQADGVVLGSSSATLIDSAISGQRNGLSLGTDGFTSVNNTVQVSGGSIGSVTGAAIYAEAGTNTVNLGQGAQLTSGNGILLNVVGSGTTVNLAATDHVGLNGDVVVGASSTANIALSQASSLTGAMHHAGNVSVDGDSLWNITASSDVRQMALAGNAVFASPLQGYKTLVVQGDLAGYGGVFTLNTTLNEGGPLNKQFTDRVLVEGNATGTTYLNVIGSGSGALTDTNKNGVMESAEGISLAQVAGQSSASVFALRGGYVAVGPWRYELQSYQPGNADAGQRLVAGAGNGFWDYRLQNAYVAPDPTPDPTPGPTPRPAVVPQVPSYLTASTAMLSYGMRSIATLHDRLGEIHQDTNSADRNDGEFYARAFGGDYRYSSNRSFDQYGYGFDQNDRAVQIGGTWLKVAADASTWRLGAYGVTGTSRITPHAVDGDSRMRMSGNSLALTGTYEHANGFYVDGVVARNFYRTSVDTAERGSSMADFRTRGWSYSLEGGYPFVFGNEVRLEPQVQAVYQTLRTSAFTDRDGLSVSPESSGTWVGRVGANLSKTFITGSGQHWTPWARVNYLTSSGSSTVVSLASEAWGVSDTLRSGKWGSTVQMGAGVTGALSNVLSIYGGADFQTDVGSAGEQGWSANLGLRWRF